jgi:hypothetical protein
VGFASPSSFRHPFLQCQQLIVQAGAGKQVLNRSDLQALPHVKVTVSEYGFFSSATELSIDANTNVASPSVVSGSPAPQITINIGGYGVAFPKLVP